jgi:D-alanyl-lipoteichoic acid acyltransferase DltB (MBOAT superfamily)
MLFNSNEFIFAFLPLTLLGFFLLGGRSRRLALYWLTAASLVFYAWWRPVNVLIIAPSIAINFVLARLLLRLVAAGEGRIRAARAVLALGIVFNVCFLGYFKYVNFLATIAHDLTGADFVLVELVLPLGISFITFQKIAFLVDIYGRRVQSFTLSSYALFVLFFPQLIAGPIVHYREMIPQFERAPCRFETEGFAVGATMFMFGLFKKAVMADGISVYVSPLFDAAAGGTPLTMTGAWIAALGFTLQIYFDFSGYTDMALGLARMVGVRLPPNFDSPLKAASIIDFWLRWHMTLTRFLTAYLYNPLVLWLTRRRVARGKSVMAGRSTTVVTFASLLAAPTLLTMLVSGVWHGAGYMFVLWGLLHGVYLTVNHAWRIFGTRLFGGAAVELVRGWPSFVLTFLAVAVAMVFFRSTNAAAAESILTGMLGLHGIGLPERLFAPVAWLAARAGGWLHVSSEISATDLVAAWGWLVALLGVAWLLPNTLQVLERFAPGLSASRDTAFQLRRLRVALTWSPTLTWAAAVGLLAALCVVRMGGQSEFLYWQF